MNAVYLQTNDAERNEVVAFRREADGTLDALGSYATEGRGTGKPHLPSQSSIVVSGDRLLVVNAGSDEITLFAIAAEGLSLLDRVGSGGTMPTSIAVRGTSVFVLNAGGEANVTGFSLGDTRARADRRHARASRCGSRADRLHARRLVADRQRPRQRCAARAPGRRRRADAPLVLRCDAVRLRLHARRDARGHRGIWRDGRRCRHVVLRRRAQPVSKSVANTRSEVCWAAVTKDGRYVFVTNFGDGSISSYAIGADGSLTLVDAVAGSTVLGEKGVRDEALSATAASCTRSTPTRGRSSRSRCATTAGSIRSATSTACRRRPRGSRPSDSGRHRGARTRRALMQMSM